MGTWGQSEDRGAEDEITCLFLGGRPCLGKAKGRGGPASSGGDQADPGNRRRGGGSPGRRALRPPCSIGCGGTSRWSWVRSQPWSAGDWIFSRARKWRFGLQWGNRCWKLPALRQLQPLQPILPAPVSPPATGKNPCSRRRLEHWAGGCRTSRWDRQQTACLVRRSRLARQLCSPWLSRKLQQILEPGSAKADFPHKPALLGDILAHFCTSSTSVLHNKI